MNWPQFEVRGGSTYDLLAWEGPRPTGSSHTPFFLHPTQLACALFMWQPLHLAILETKWMFNVLGGFRITKGPSESLVKMQLCSL